MASVSIYVDSREASLYTLLQAMMEDDVSITLERRQLDLGDIHIIGPSSLHIIERKSWADLCASLFDSRYKEQKVRLLAERERCASAEPPVPCRITYLIESPVVPLSTQKTRAVNNSNAHAALEAMACRDKIPAVWMANASESARHIIRMARKSASGAYDESSANPAAGYAAFVKHSNKRKNREDNQFAIMLSSIPGVSARSAAPIVAAYPTPALLVRAFSQTVKPEALLCDMEVGNNRRLGPALSKRIHSIFS